MKTLNMMKNIQHCNHPSRLSKSLESGEPTTTVCVQLQFCLLIFCGCATVPDANWQQEGAAAFPLHFLPRKIMRSNYNTGWSMHGSSECNISLGYISTLVGKKKQKTNSSEVYVPRVVKSQLARSPDLHYSHTEIVASH